MNAENLTPGSNETGQNPGQGHGPRTEEERLIYEKVKEALDRGDSKSYASVADFMREISELASQRKK